MEDVVVVIPSLEPDVRLLDLLASIRKHSRSWPVIVVNDGSNDSFSEVFEEAQNKYQCILIHHSLNKGKGAAIKTAIRYILTNLKSAQYMVTIDSDGQHTLDDMIGCIQAAEVHGNSLVLGVREFDQKTPIRSRFGNILTRNVLRLTTGINIKDTQTGLRVIPVGFMEKLLEVPGDRFEYETNMLLESKRSNWNIHSQEISTIYLENNASSHFRVIADSVAIYSVFIKYFLSSASAFLVDVGIYAILISLQKNTSLQAIALSSICARGISSLFNYLVNRNLVFRNNSDSSLLKYFALVAVQILFSAYLVHFGHVLFPSLDTVPVKIMVDGLLFFLSYYIQKNYIFKR